MTATGTATPTTAIEITAETAEIARRLILSGTDLIEILKVVGLAPAPEKVEGTVPEPQQITEQHLAALKALPELFGVVNPSAARALTAPEKKSVDSERSAITTIEKLVGDRKEALRHILHNHLDRIAEKTGLAEGQDKDANGHLLVKNSDAIDGTDREIARTLQNFSPTYNSVTLFRAFEAGLITKEQYFALTGTPEVKRVIEPAKAAKAIAKDPELLGILAKYGTSPGRKQSQITIKKRSRG